ncbi:MAG: PQQ-binding-like beta-propeller repeat protein [Pirellulales bacterium]
MAIAAVVFSASLVRAENWPSFRGPTGMGISGERALPTTWDGKSGKNIVWRAALRPTVDDGKADLNQSSPIVLGDRVIVATAYWPKDGSQKETPEQHVTCYATSDGSELWDAVVPPGPWQLTDLRGGYGAPTPATDGERIYVAFGSATLAALDMNGKPLWRRDVENHASIDVAMASSPVVFEGRVILLSDKNNKHSTLTAYDGKTGEVAWSQARPDVAFNHSTPTLATIEGKQRMFVAASNALQAIDPTNGEVVWSCATPGDVMSPIFHDGLVYSDSGRGGPGVCVAAGGSGDVTATHVRWRIGNVPEALASPMVAGGMLFRTHNPGVLKCVDWGSGKQVFSARLGGVSMQASPVVTADGLVYFASGGRSVVVRPGESLDIVATNELDDASAASPAVSQGRLFIKGGRYLYCIGTK